MKTLTALKDISQCPICEERVSVISAHIKASHKKEEVENAIIADKSLGISDVEIGRLYGITYRKLENIIRNATGISVSSLKAERIIKTFEPKDFKAATTTVWSFKSRGNWATHSGQYRGNWSPYIPRNVILRYSAPGELVLDYFCGAGTTAIEAKLLGRRCIAFDINDKAIELTQRNVAFQVPVREPLFHKIYEPELFKADARDLSFLKNSSVDLICAHPPYTNIIHYTEHEEGDLSQLDIELFLKEMAKVARESFRVLKPGRQCAILIGDLRRHKHVIPLGFEVINIYLNAGFRLKELIIKRQHNCKTTGFWYANSIKYNFLLLAHEYLPIFEKPSEHLPEAKERMAFYGEISQSLKRIRPKAEIKESETATVWIFPEAHKEKLLNNTVLNRYSDGISFKVIDLTLAEPALLPSQSKRQRLLFIKSSCLEKNEYSEQETELYLEKLNKLLSSELPLLESGGYCVIQTRDVRTGEYLTPLAKKIVDYTPSNMHLKEIIVVTAENQKSAQSDIPPNLKTTHQYLLVYVKKGKDL